MNRLWCGIVCAEFGRAFATKRRGRIAWRLHTGYTEHLAGADLRRFDWTKVQQLRDVRLVLWMVFTSPRVRIARF